MPFGAGYGISSRMGVGFIGVVSGEGILSILMISSGFFSPSSTCPHDLV